MVFMIYQNARATVNDPLYPPSSGERWKVNVPLSFPISGIYNDPPVRIWGIGDALYMINFAQNSSRIVSIRLHKVLKSTGELVFARDYYPGLFDYGSMDLQGNSHALFISHSLFLMKINLDGVLEWQKNYSFPTVDGLWCDDTAVYACGRKNIVKYTLNGTMMWNNSVGMSWIQVRLHGLGTRVISIGWNGSAGGVHMLSWESNGTLIAAKNFLNWTYLDSPSLWGAGDSLFIRSSNDLYKVNTTSGSILWVKPVPEYTHVFGSSSALFISGASYPRPAWWIVLGAEYDSLGITKIDKETGIAFGDRVYIGDDISISSNGDIWADEEDVYLVGRNYSMSGLVVLKWSQRFQPIVDFIAVQWPNNDVSPAESTAPMKTEVGFLFVGFAGEKDSTFRLNFGDLTPEVVFTVLHEGHSPQPIPDYGKTQIYISQEKGLLLTHRFRTFGIFTITLTVTDRLGQAVTCRKENYITITIDETIFQVPDFWIFVGGIAGAIVVIAIMRKRRGDSPSDRIGKNPGAAHDPDVN